MPKSMRYMAKIASEMVRTLFWKISEREQNEVRATHTASDPLEVNIEATGRVKPRRSIASMQITVPTSM